jgi:hypothetical protein
MLRGKTLLAPVLLAAAVALASPTCSATEQLRFKVIADSVIVVPVLVNGRGPFDFVLDTGTESSMIDTDLAQELGIAAIDRVVVGSANGSSAVGRSFANEISFGPTRVLHSEVLIGSLDAMHSVNRRIRGIIGQNVLKHFDFLLDNVHSVIQFDPTSGSRDLTDGSFRLRLSHGRPVLWATLPNSSQLSLVLDSGASNLVLYSASQDAVLRCFGGGCLSAVTSSSAISQVEMGQIPDMEIAGRRFHHLQAALLNNRSDAEVDGLLPTRLFTAIYFNNSAGFVVLGSARTH